MNEDNVYGDSYFVRLIFLQSEYAAKVITEVKFENFCCRT